MLHQGKAVSVSSIQERTGISDEVQAEYPYNILEPLCAGMPTVNSALIQGAFREVTAKTGSKARSCLSKVLENSLVEKRPSNNWLIRSARIALPLGHVLDLRG